MEEHNAEEEMKIAENDHLLHNTDKTLNAINNHYREIRENGDWHYVRK